MGRAFITPPWMARQCLRELLRAIPGWRRPLRLLIGNPELPFWCRWYRVADRGARGRAAQIVLSIDQWTHIALKEPDDIIEQDIPRLLAPHIKRAQRRHA